MDVGKGETEIGGEQREFRTTLSTIVLKAKDPDSPDGCDALERLIQAYWKPLYFFILKNEAQP